MRIRWPFALRRDLDAERASHHATKAQLKQAAEGWREAREGSVLTKRLLAAVALQRGGRTRVPLSETERAASYEIAVRFDQHGAPPSAVVEAVRREFFRG